MKQKYKIAHMKAALAYGACSTAQKAQVGCVIVKDNRIISIGYNGMPSGWDNVCEYEKKGSSGGLPMSGLFTKPEVLHAETNAIAKVAGSNESSQGAVLFTTLSPCFDCSKLIYQAGIVKVYYFKEYACGADAIAFLEKCGVEVERVDLDDMV